MLNWFKKETQEKPESPKVERVFLDYDLNKEFKEDDKLAEESKKQRLSKDDMEALIFYLVAKHMKRDIMDITYDTPIDRQSFIDAGSNDVFGPSHVGMRWELRDNPSFGKNMKWAGNWADIKTVQDLINFATKADKYPKGPFFL